MPSKILRNHKQLFIGAFFWGFLLWLFGYILGFIFFAFVPQEMIGWYITPFGILATLWVLFKKITGKEMKLYLSLALVWTIIAVLLDYVFIVKLLNSNEYYKLDVYLYYTLTLTLPLLMGWYKVYFTKRS